MEPVTVDLADQLAKLLQSGGSAATVAIVWIALKLKTAVTGYLSALNETLAKLTTATTQLSVDLKKLQDVLERAPPPPVRLVERRSDP
jgi:hypothetical protein